MSDLLLQHSVASNCVGTRRVRSKRVISKILGVQNGCTRVVVYISSSFSQFWQLAIRSRDLSWAEKKIIVVKPEQFIKMTFIFTQNGQKLSFWVNHFEWNGSQSHNHKSVSPEQGLEPWTFRLKAWRSTNWATRALVTW